MGEFVNAVQAVYDKSYFSEYGHDGKHYCENIAIRLTLKGLAAFLCEKLPTLRGGDHLDVGCAMGFLVKYMREKGVRSYGFDVSEYAIRNAIPEARRYVWLQDVVDGEISKKYDLITCIEVIEHIQPGKEWIVLRKIAQKAKWIYLSSEYNLKESTHINCKPLSYWIYVMWKLGYAPKLDIYSWIPWGRIYYKPRELKSLENYLELHTREEICRRDGRFCVICRRGANNIYFVVSREEFDTDKIWEAYAHWNRVILCDSCAEKLKNSMFVEALQYKLRDE